MHFKEAGTPLDRDPSILPLPTESGGNITAARRLGRGGMALAASLTLAGGLLASNLNPSEQPLTSAVTEAEALLPTADASSLDGVAADVTPAPTTGPTAHITTAPAEVAPEPTTATVPNKPIVTTTTQPAVTTIKPAPRLAATTSTTTAPRTGTWSSPDYSLNGTPKPESALQPDPVIVQTARGEIGQNDIEYTAGGYWCVKFVSEMANRAKVNTYIQFSDGPELVANKARANGSMKDIKDAKVGDVAIIDLLAHSSSSTSSPDLQGVGGGYQKENHVGIVSKVITKTVTKGPVSAQVVVAVMTIERNPVPGKPDVVVEMTRSADDPSFVGVAKMTETNTT